MRGITFRKNIFHKNMLYLDIIQEVLKIDNKYFKDRFFVTF